MSNSNSPEKHDWSDEGLSAKRIRAQFEHIHQKISEANTPQEKFKAYCLYLKMIGVDLFLGFLSLFPEAKNDDENNR